MVILSTEEALQKLACFVCIGVLQDIMKFVADLKAPL